MEDLSLRAESAQALRRTGRLWGNSADGFNRGIFRQDEARNGRILNVIVIVYSIHLEIVVSGFREGSVLDAYCE